MGETLEALAATMRKGDELRVLATRDGTMVLSLGGRSVEVVRDDLERGLLVLLDHQENRA